MNGPYEVVCSDHGLLRRCADPVDASQRAVVHALLCRGAVSVS